MLIYNSNSFISPIARQYFAKVNQLGGDVQDKKAINDFVIQLSRIIDPSLWVCWPLRSSQSIGGGTTAPSLGLLGNFPGTLINGPTWSSTGIVSTSTRYIEVNPIIPSSPLPSFMYYVVNVSDTTNDPPTNRFFQINETSIAANQQYMTINKYGTSVVLPNTSTSAQVLFNATVYPANFWHSIACTVEGGSLKSFIDAGLRASLARTFTSAGNYNKTRIFSDAPGSHAFGLLSVVNLTTSQIIFLNNLYKNTLGIGLGLP